MTDRQMLDILSTFSQATDESKPLTEGKRTVTADTAMADILGKLQQLNEGAEGKMPSKKHVMDMCKDGMSKKEMCDMHPDCDQGKLKDMIDDCKEEMKDSKEEMDEASCGSSMKKKMKESAIAEGVAQIEQRLLKEFAEFAEAKQELDEGAMKDMMHRDAERMERADFVEKHGEEHGEFWDAVMGDLDEGNALEAGKELFNKFRRKIFPAFKVAPKRPDPLPLPPKKNEGKMEEDPISGALAQAQQDGKAEFEVDGKKYKVTEMFDKQDEVGSKKKTKHGTAEKTATGMKHTRDYKPDYLDLDGDGDKKEPMKKAAKDKKAKEKK